MAGSFVWMPTVLDSNSETMEEFVDKVFYGVRLDSRTGRATIDRIAGDAPISLPTATRTRPDDYRNWMWSNNSFDFRWDTETGNLLMEVL